jgi:hypothetical protein
VTYNKRTKVRDSATGKRVNRPKPPEEWKTSTDEALRIVPQALWGQVQARIQSRRIERRRPGAMVAD